MSEPLVLTVSQLNTYIKSLIETEGALRSVFVAGEISNFVRHTKSGHLYFTLKDESGVLKAVMFRPYAVKLPFAPQNGMKVICRGRVSVYERDGVYQLYAEQMQPDGVGALKVAFDQLCTKLREEGLFEESHKKPIPAYPARIAVITSPTGAALQDILQILGRRMPVAEVVVYPALVQGERAAASLTNAVVQADRDGTADLILIGRGGGSIEDLWAFNDERLARAIYHCNTPVISCVGHETDFTVCDFVADLRAPTPSAAAELSVPDRRDVSIRLERLRRSARAAVVHMWQICANRLKVLSDHPLLRAPSSYIDAQYETLDKLTLACQKASAAYLQNHEQRLALLCAKLDAFSPMKTLSRGYAIPFHNGTILRTIRDIAPGDEIDLTMADGTAVCHVDECR